MAIVKMTPDVITSIVAKVRQLHEADRKNIDINLPEAPKNMGEQLYSLIMPAEDQEKVHNIMPPHLRQFQADMGVCIIPAGVKRDNFSPVLYFALPEFKYIPFPTFDTTDFPGTDCAIWDRGVLNLYLKEDWSELQVDKDAKDFIEKVIAPVYEHAKITEASKAAAATMREFLEQHKTVQSALKEAGPALKGYFDPWLQALLDRVTPKRVRRTKEQKEKVKVNINKLIAKVTTNQLNIE